MKKVISANKMIKKLSSISEGVVHLDDSEFNTFILSSMDVVLADKIAVFKKLQKDKYSGITSISPVRYGLKIKFQDGAGYTLLSMIKKELKSIGLTVVED